MNNKFLLFFIVLFSLLSLQKSFSQTEKIVLNSKVKGKQQTIENNKQENSKKYWLAVAEVFGLNILVWADSRYLTHQDWAYISGESIKNNFEKGFTWDGDSFVMNQFLHPFHGSIYFNTARTNGLSFWESAPCVLGGSLMWEYAMEIERPSYNDLINTTLSGIMLGEITYRVSDIIIDESTVGFERVIRELTASIINPAKGFNRLIQGKLWRHGKKIKNHKFTLQLSLGLNSLFIKNSISKNYLYSLTTFDIDYGNKFKLSQHKKPFDYIRIHGEMSFTNGDNIFGISASGVLWDKKFPIFNAKNNIIAFYKEFDYLENYIYKFSATSATSEITNISVLGNNTLLQSSFGFSTVFVGGSNSIYSSEVGKNYNLGPGLGMRVILNLKLTEKIAVNFKYRQFWFHILNGLSGDEFIGFHKLGINYMLSKNNSIGTDIIFYERHGSYADYPNVHSSNLSLRIFTKFYL